MLPRMAYTYLLGNQFGISHRRFSHACISFIHSILSITKLIFLNISTPSKLIPNLMNFMLIPSKVELCCQTMLHTSVPDQLFHIQQSQSSHKSYIYYRFSYYSVKICLSKSVFSLPSKFLSFNTNFLIYSTLHLPNIIPVHTFLGLHFLTHTASLSSNRKSTIPGSKRYNDLLLHSFPFLSSFFLGG